MRSWGPFVLQFSFLFLIDRELAVIFSDTGCTPVIDAAYDALFLSLSVFIIVSSLPIRRLFSCFFPGLASLMIFSFFILMHLDRPLLCGRGADR